MSGNAAGAVAQAEAYYDSDDADRFYFQVWGGEDIHIGVYTGPDEPIPDASHRTLTKMAEQLESVDQGQRVLDLGSGYGGAARFLHDRFGCSVTCLNLSETQNERNRRLNEERGVSDAIDVVYGNFEELPFPDGTFDVVWSQDAFLHSGHRELVLKELHRVLVPGGRVIFTDPMQADDCPPGVLQPVLDRIHLETLGSFAFYRSQLGQLGFKELSVVDMTDQLGNHYARVRAELLGRRDELEKVISPGYIERMLAGLQHWVDARKSGYLSWGILLFQKPS